MEKLTASAKEGKQPEESSQAVETEVKYQHLASKKQRVVAWKYDVFVSFRGEDIRKGFIDHLFKDFKQNGIHAFRDNIDLPRGEEISSHLYKAIENSRFLVVIFSKNYASSSWCLRELVKILDSKQMEKPKHEVRILFYDVKPETVRKQTESYAEAFAKHEVSNRAEVDKWREALSMAANLSGWDLHDMKIGYEPKFVDRISKDIHEMLCDVPLHVGERISKDIHEMLCDVPLHVGEKLVGVDARLSKLNLVRFIRSSKVNMIGICGISGIGKTTIAKAIYRWMYAHFEGRCFCEDVQEVTKRQGLHQVQTQIIHNIMKTEDVNISGISEGIMVIKEKVECKPILLVLDDVDHHEQLDALAGSHDWFCPGSLIIFTGKDKQLLRSHGVDEIYDVEFLDDGEDIKLFCLYAFGQTYPTHDFKELSHEVVRCLQGHPLALKVVGKTLFKKSPRIWRSELGSLQVYSNPEIQQKLRPSFDLLNFDQKRIFLDIACSLIGENRDLSARVLDSINCFADANIDVLVDKYLITISSDDSLQMHELIRRMAMEVLREEPEWPIRLRGLSAVGAVLGENNDSEPAMPSCRHFIFHDILSATRNFDESLVIGHGGFGKVYKVNIIMDGSSSVVAAIKRLDTMSGQGAAEFWAEVETLSQLRHCNLVSLFGYCNHGKELILVYEYISNGTLEDHLHKLGTPLNWLQRLKICIGAGRGLHYLHTGTGIESGVIHRDVKSSNILLHENWAAKISDFGLSKIGPTNQPTTYVNTLIKGTFGYLDPDYASTGKLTRKSDVYAFGVVMLELLCRRRALDRSLDEEQMNLARWVQESIKEGNLKHIVDSDIRGEIAPKSLKEFVRIAEGCLHTSTKQRLTMAQVLVGLENVLILQEKYNNSLQPAGRTPLGRKWFKNR